MRKLIVLGTFFVISPILLLFSLVFFFFRVSAQGQTLSVVSIPKNVSYAALPSIENTLSQQVTGQDARVEIVRQFFHKYQSPLEPYADFLVRTEDAYRLDFRLLAAIAMQESNLCLKAPLGSDNCWGFGIYDGKVTRFANYEDAITTVAKTLSSDYANKGLVEPSAIVSRYTPSDNGRWVSSVNYFMNQLQ